MCGARSYLPADLVSAAIAMEKRRGWAVESDVQRALRCTLQEHPAGQDHQAFVMELDGVSTGSVWARWADGGTPAGVETLPDCRGGEDGMPCREAAEHQGGHSSQTHDPLVEIVDRLMSG